MHLTAWLALAVTSSVITFAQTPVFSVVYRFTSESEGSDPNEPLLLHNGILYGTTYNGSAAGLGVAYAVDISTRSETILHNFAQTDTLDGHLPASGLKADAQGNLYGVTQAGGASDHGTLYRIDTSGTESVLYSFSSEQDGAQPTGRLVIDSNGAIFGVTYYTGAPSYGGSVWQFTPSAAVRILHDFGAKGDGTNPSAGLLAIGSDLYGACSQAGAYGGGTIYQVDPRTRTEIILYNFTGGVDGAEPVTSLITDGAGNLLGSTAAGGDLNKCSGRGCGVIYSLNVATGQLTVLYTFEDGVDGSSPSALVRDSAGNLFGTTEKGGVAHRGNIFEIDTSGQFTGLYSFTGGEDGSLPRTSLTRSPNGRLYGVASAGGYGFGTIFEVTL